ncbi:Uncharacterized protein APZ42_021247 [Daphnia magna]|uniref:Uncharacterized protein n=1 Tax=Daphnia magna TaxID=35525 RepID=A0A164WUA1_9CRUS|nr:Uncharacterized protein APZ42_021247 [Daphnia magna]
MTFRNFQTDIPSEACGMKDDLVPSVTLSPGAPTAAHPPHKLADNKKKKKLSPSSLCFSSFVCLLSRIGAVIERRPQSACRSLSEMLVVCARRGKKMDNEIGWRCTQTHAQQAER